MNKLLRLVLIPVLLAVGAFTSIAVMDKYSDYQAAKSHDAQLQAEADAKQNQAAKDAQANELASRDARILTLHAECLKGVTIHGLLPLATRQKTAAPVCE